MTQSSYRKIRLTQGKWALVDAVDYERLAAFKWYAYRNPKGLSWYASRNGRANGKRCRVLMHREVLRAEPGSLWDHRNRNGLDNRRRNLRPCTRRDNARNRERLRITKTSRYRGVCWYAPTKTWKVQIQGAAGKVHLGYHRNEVAAARAYDAAAVEHFGEFAILNFRQAVAA